MFKPTLDNQSIYQKLDKSQIYDSIINLKNQVQQAWIETSNLPLGSKASEAKNVVVAGMGGSALGGRIIRSLDQYILNLPLEIVTNYRLPNYVNKQSLVFVISYSGNTEEALSCYLDAKSRGAHLFVITSGGKLAELATRDGHDRYIFEPKFNPSNQPRMGLGYSIISQFSVMSRLRFLNFDEKDLEAIVSTLETVEASMSKSISINENPAKQLAQKIKSSFLILFSANHLNGTAHAFKNMINENSKLFSASFEIPELNHHLLEGINLPKDLKDRAHFILIDSNLYPSLIQKRLKITRDILSKHSMPSTVLKPEAKTPVAQAFETLSFGSYLSFYLSILAGVDPGPIPSVDYFKRELTKPTS